MRIFYIRVSTEDQNEQRQQILAEQFGSERIYIDKASGATVQRKQYNEMMNYIREGDVIGTESISRIARNTKDLLSFIEILQEKNVQFISIKENIDTESPSGKFMITVFAAVAQLERENILQRQAEGIAAAKAAGKYKGRPPQKIDERRFQALVAEWRAGKRTATSIQREFHVSATTFYRWIRDRF